MSRTKPTANHTPQASAYAPMLSSIVPPVLRITGRNFRTGQRMNFTFAKNFAIKTPITPRGPSAFLNGPPLADPSGGDGAGLKIGGATSGGGGGGGGGNWPCSIRYYWGRKRLGSIP